MNPEEITNGGIQSHSSPKAAFTAMHWPRKPLPKGKGGGKLAGKTRGGRGIKKG